MLVFNILRTSGALEHTQEPSEVTVKLFFFFLFVFSEKRQLKGRRKLTMDIRLFLLWFNIKFLVYNSTQITFLSFLSLFLSFFFCCFFECRRLWESFELNIWSEQLSLVSLYSRLLFCLFFSRVTLHRNIHNVFSFMKTVSTCRSKKQTRERTRKISKRIKGI